MKDSVKVRPVDIIVITGSFRDFWGVQSKTVFWYAIILVYKLVYAGDVTLV